MKQLRTRFLAIVLLFSLSATAQHKTASFIGLSGGISIPTGNWSKTNYDDNRSGFAAVGPQVAVDGAYFFSKHIGVGALVNYSSYKTKDIDVLSAGYLEAFEADQATTTAGHYEIWNFMPGLYFNFPVKTFSVTARALAGLTHATTPYISVNLVADDIDDGTMEQKEAAKNSFGFDIGAGIRYPVAKRFAVNLMVDYCYANPDFKIENINHQNNAGRLVTEYHQPLTSVNISLGIAYLFGTR